MHKDGTSAETANADVYVLDSNIIRFLIDRIHFDEGQVLEDKHRVARSNSALED